MIRHDDGRPSFIVFNIKAGPEWSGDRVSRATLEHLDGSVVRVDAAFRAYPSLDAAFDDYVDLIATSPRYAEARAAEDAAGYVQALQAGGYATDPAYADKVTRVLASERLSAALKKPDDGPIT
jgi:flagellar protein FlgJ